MHNSFGMFAYVICNFLLSPWFSNFWTVFCPDFWMQMCTDIWTWCKAASSEAFFSLVVRSWIVLLENSGVWQNQYFAMIFKASFAYREYLYTILTSYKWHTSTKNNSKGLLLLQLERNQLELIDKSMVLTSHHSWAYIASTSFLPLQLLKFLSLVVFRAPSFSPRWPFWPSWYQMLPSGCIIRAVKWKPPK